MASTTSPSFSTSTSLSQFWNYDVYLSFRGQDIRKNFADHLYTALHQRDILTYKDDETHPHGEPIAPFLVKVIEESRISIIIFSENYAYSSWCLNELVYIMRCRDERGQTVIPIFYHVDPSDVRKQKGKFGQAFPRHEITNNEKVESWRKALVNVSAISGWTLNNNPDSRESICIKQVVDMISNKLYPSEDLIETGTHLQDPKSRGGDWLHNHFRKTNISVSSSNLSSRTSYYTPASSFKLRNHDVFISFGVEDMASYNFVDHLYSALDQREILTYKEEETPPLSESIESSNFKAIEGSQIVIIIFSQGYARSSWCLDELAYIMKCMNEKGKIVMPIFYHVDPGCYGEAFLGHELEKKNKVESWRKALKDASNLSGWHIAASGYESKGIKLIVDLISKRLLSDKGLILGNTTRLEYLKYGGGGMTTLAASHGEIEHLKVRLQEILLATNNFAESEIIAKGGGFGKVYRGQSEQHGDIAVKRLDRKLGQGDREFMNEIALLSICKHENIVSLVGYCDQDDDKILVYKLESNGSLDKHLPNKDITWIQRLQICLDAANGLKYLHDHVLHQHRIVHRDVKSSNILLDENWKAKISDFGLSKIALANVGSVIFSGACGTPGYVDPLYINYDKVTQKSDVYSFGVVLFEVLFGRLVFDSLEYPDERYFSVKLAQDHYKNGALDEIISSDLRSQMNADSLYTFSTIACLCLKKRREDRPTMSLIVDQLEKALELQQIRTHAIHGAHENIDKTLKGADVILDRFDLSREAEDLESYLEAIVFFTNNKSFKSSDEVISHARNLLSKAISKLEQEYKQLLSSYSKSVEPDRLYECLPISLRPGSHIIDTGGQITAENDVFTPLILIPPRVLRLLHDLAQHMVQAGHIQQCQVIYRETRCTVLEETLQKLGVEKLNKDDVQKMQWEVLELKIGTWIHFMRIAVKLLFTAERKVCDQMFEGIELLKDQCFAEVTAGSVAMLLSFGDAIAKSKRSPEKLFVLLDMYEIMRELHSEIESLFRGKACKDIRESALGLTKRLAQTAQETFGDFEEAVEKDATKTAVSDGTVHPLTSYVINYVKFLFDYQSTLKQLFQEFENVEDSNSQLASVTMRIMQALQINLEGKSKQYKDPALTNLFLMNNIHYMVRSVRRSEAKDLLGDDWVQRHRRVVQQHANQYKRIAWAKILQCLSIQGLSSSGGSGSVGGGDGGNSSGASRALIKDRLKIFNGQFEELHQRQTQWTVPDTELRESLRLAVAEVLLPAYRSFIKRFGALVENGKNSHKYIRYTAEDLDRMLGEFFEGKSMNEARR